ncbi:hypothetical protein [Actinosynnema sp. NPDC020468]|uniref:hypothetical protein n=1 Tax=Actinosynnema sp. NPDC020468 TaxID=3154488 RepID=UPI0033E7E601
MDDPEDGLAEVRRQREAMGARVRLPVWHRVLFAVAWTGVLLGPLSARDHARLGLPAFPYWFLTTAVLLVVLADFRRRSGLHLVVRSRAYPGLRRMVVPTAAVVVGSVVVVWGLTVLHLPYAALGCAVSAGGLTARQAWKVNQAVRRDVLAGR